MQIGAVKMNVWNWNTTIKKGLNWSKISMKKYQNMPTLGVKSVKKMLSNQELLVYRPFLIDPYIVYMVP